MVSTAEFPNVRNDLDSDASASSILRSIRDAGHQVASHTFQHLDLQTLTIDELWAEVRRNDVAITNVLGRAYAPKFIRAPYGSMNANVLRALESWGYRVVGNLNFTLSRYGTTS